MTADKILPSLDLLEAHLLKGDSLSRWDDSWWLFKPDGAGVISGKTLRELLVNLIFMEC